MLALSAAERGVGLVFGLEPSQPPLPIPRHSPSPRSVLEALVLDRLRRPPCGVSFSGGRDSSLVLAVATAVARREGLDDPVPISLHFPDVQSAHETNWQESVVSHLDLKSWVRIELRDELDLVGPIAASVLQRHGVQWPFNVYFHAPMLDRVRGGSMLTGVGGDEILSPGWTWRRENEVLARQRPPLPLDPVRLAIACGPALLKRAFLTWRSKADGPTEPPVWLTRAGWDAIHEAIRAARAMESLSFTRSVRHSYARRRGRLIGNANLDSLAAEHNVVLTSPLAHDQFLAAMCAARGWRMFRSRTEATQWLAGDVLPRPLTARPTKAWFDGAFFNDHSRRFVAGWDGTGLDPAYVRPEVLKQMWTTADDEPPDARTYPLLQAAWLASRSPRSVE